MSLHADALRQLFADLERLDFAGVPACRRLARACATPRGLKFLPSPSG